MASRAGVNVNFQISGSDQGVDLVRQLQRGSNARGTKVHLENLRNLQEVVKLWKAAGLLGLGLSPPGVAHGSPTSFLQEAFLGHPGLLSCTPKASLPEPLVRSSTPDSAVGRHLPGRPRGPHPR